MIGSASHGQLFSCSWKFESLSFFAHVLGYKFGLCEDSYIYSEDLLASLIASTSNKKALFPRILWKL